MGGHLTVILFMRTNTQIVGKKVTTRKIRPLNFIYSYIISIDGFLLIFMAISSL